MSGPRAELRAFHLAARHGHRLCLLHRPAERSLAGALVYVHPFAEEMNKARRMAALMSREFARAGYAVLQIDLQGCGDSSGDFGDATWQNWVDDVRRAERWLAEETGLTPWLWGLRAGCLLCVEADSGTTEVARRFLFWQPSSSGKTTLQQFRRLRTAAEALRATEAPRDLPRLVPAKRTPPTASSASGYEEVAGYLLNPDLAQEMAASYLRPPLKASRSVWIEVNTRGGDALLPATMRSVQEWVAAGHETVVEIVTGPAFWQSQEIETAPGLLSATLNLVLVADRASETVV